MEQTTTGRILFVQIDGPHNANIGETADRAAWQTLSGAVLRVAWIGRDFWKWSVSTIPSPEQGPSSMGHWRSSSRRLSSLRAAPRSLFQNDTFGFYASKILINSNTLTC